MSSRQKKDIIQLTRLTPGQYAQAAKHPLRLLLDNVRSQNNVGSLFRTSDVLAIEAMTLCGITGTPPHPDIAKTALGADQTVEWAYEEDSLEAVKKLKEQGYEVLVLEQAQGSVPLQQFIPTSGKKYVLVAGNEVHGVDQRIVDLADTVIEIDQYGTKHSLNVCVSTAIALWHITQHMAPLP